MRSPIGLIRNERNDKLYSEDAYDVFATIPCIELGLKQAAVYRLRSIQCDDDDGKQAVIQKLQDDRLPFRMCIDSLLNNDWVAECKDIMLVHSLKYCTIATTRYDLQNKVASTKIGIIPDIAKGVKDSEN